MPGAKFIWKRFPCIVHNKSPFLDRTFGRWKEMCAKIISAKCFNNHSVLRHNAWCLYREAEEEILRLALRRFISDSDSRQGAKNGGSKGGGCGTVGVCGGHWLIIPHLRAGSVWKGVESASPLRIWSWAGAHSKAQSAPIYTGWRHL